MGIIRGGDGTDKFGKPFSFVCTITKNGDEAHIEGAIGWSDGMREALTEALKKEGIVKVKWERIKDGNVRFIEVKLK
jgi:hypothetical protein